MSWRSLLLCTMLFAASSIGFAASPAGAGDPPPIIVQLDIFIPSETVSFESYHAFLGNDRGFGEAGNSVARVELRFSTDGELIGSQVLAHNWVGVTGPIDQVPFQPSWWHQSTDDSDFTLEVEADVIQTFVTGSVGEANTFQLSLSIGNAFDVEMPRVDSQLLISIGPDPEAVDLDAQDVIVQTVLTHDSWPNYQVKIDGSEVYRHDVEDDAGSPGDGADSLLNSTRSSGLIEVHHQGGPGPNNPKDVREGRNGKNGGGSGFNPGTGGTSGPGGGGGGGGGDQVPFDCDGTTILIDNTTDAHIQAAEDCAPAPVPIT